MVSFIAVAHALDMLMEKNKMVVHTTASSLRFGLCIPSVTGEIASALVG
jgi:hypothetical protein